MNSTCRAAALAALSWSALAFASAPPAAKPAAAPAAKAPSMEYPSTCNAAAKPLFLKSIEAGANLRQDEERSLLTQTLAADPKCAVAKAQLAQMTPGAEGNTMFSEALGMTAGLSEYEKLHLQAMDAERAGESEKAYATYEKMRDLAPHVFATYMLLANAAQGLAKHDAALVASKKATELNPKAGEAWNLLGYANINLKKTDDAVAAFKKYVEVAPTEANAHDSLADALLRAGKFEEAGQSYQKAIDASGGKFYMSWDGVAAVKTIAGDSEGARAALAKFKEAAVEPQAKFRASRMVAWTWQAQGKPAEALTALDAAEKEAAAGKLVPAVLHSQLTRGLFQVQNAKYADALKTFAALEKADTGALRGSEKKYLAAIRWSGTTEAQARSNKVADAEKSLQKLVEVFQGTQADPMGADLIAAAKGLVALAKKDAKGAVEILKTVSEEYDYGRAVLAEAQDLAKDAAGAAATREALLKMGHREPAYWVVRAQVEAKLKTPGKKVAAEGAKK